MSETINAAVAVTTETITATVTTGSEVITIDVNVAARGPEGGTSGGGVSSWNDLTDRPAGLLSAQAAATESIRAIGTTATTACAGNDSRLSNARTPNLHAASHVYGGADALTLTIAQISDLATASVGTSAALVFGAIDPLHAVSMSYIDDLATFTIGSAAAHALRVALIAPSRDEAGNVTIALTDHAVPIRMTSGSAAAITIPNDSAVAFPDGFIVYFRRHGAGALSLSLGVGVTVNNSVISSIAVGGTFALMWTAANTWDFI